MMMKIPTGIAESLNKGQATQLLLARLSGMTAEMVSVVAIGYSDFGTLGLRNAGEMYRIRTMLRRFQMHFASVSLLGASDETIFLYYNAFCHGMSPSKANEIVGTYRWSVRRLDSGNVSHTKESRLLRVQQAMTNTLNIIIRHSELIGKRGV